MIKLSDCLKGVYHMIEVPRLTTDFDRQVLTMYQELYQTVVELENEEQGLENEEQEEDNDE
jgi:hypothetical protein